MGRLIAELMQRMMIIIKEGKEEKAQKQRCAACEKWSLLLLSLAARLNRHKPNVDLNLNKKKMELSDDLGACSNSSFTS